MSNGPQTIVTDRDAHRAASALTVPAVMDVGTPASAAALADSIGIRMIGERIAAVARLTGRARVLITGCRNGDGASTVAGALALDLSLRLGIETLLIDADSSSGGYAAEAGGNGRPLRVHPTPVARLWRARCAKSGDRHSAGASINSTNRDEAVEELCQAMEHYRATVVDLGVVRQDARMLALAGLDDPVLLVSRYGATRREELAGTVAILKLAKCKVGGVILNGYESPATDCLQHLLGFGKTGR